MRDLHPPPWEISTVYGREHLTGESMGRDQHVRREEESALDIGDLIDLSAQDLRRLLDGDQDPELIDRIRRDLDYALERLYNRRDFG